MPDSLRLQGPLSANGTGRVEIFYHGQWGTICNYGWDMRAAKVFCRYLGYSDAVRILPSNEVPSDSGRLWLINVACTEKEQHVTNCAHIPWGINDCSHADDAGVECETSGKAAKK